MKNLLLTMILFSLFSSVGKADDSVSCDSRAFNLDVTRTDRNTLAIDFASAADLIRAEIKYAGSQYEVVIPSRTVLKNQPVQEVKLTFDLGTSIQQVFIVDWSQFEDGGQIPVKIYDLYPSVPKGDLRYRSQILCDGAQS